ncbi:MAG: hypothetical protein KIS96_07895 [Bauldia sp.]|nr:hypothetical protein [Bauldia sp.]
MRAVAWLGGLAVAVLLAVPAFAIDVAVGDGYQGATLTLGSVNDGSVSFDAGCPCQGSRIELTAVGGGKVAFRGPQLKDRPVTTTDGVVVGKLEAIGPDSSGVIMIAVDVNRRFMDGAIEVIAVFAASVRVAEDDSLQLPVDSTELMATIAAALQAGA